MDKSVKKVIIILNRLVQKGINLSKPITIKLDDVIVKKLRDKQAKLIKDCGCSVSFSTVINDTLKKALKN